MSNLFFDIDGTVVIDHDWKTLRPGTQECMAGLIGAGHQVFLWSRRGEQHCSKIAHRFGLIGVNGVATKPYKRDMVKDGPKPTVLCDLFGRREPTPIDACVDNAGKHLLEAYGGIKVPTYKSLSQHAPTSMHLVAEIINSGEALKPYIDLATRLTEVGIV